MSKKTLLKSIIAVSAATTMLISSTVFANVNVTTVTRYIAGNTTNVEVETTISGLNNADEVTYLAGDIADKIVYFDQQTAASPEGQEETEGSASATFTYQASQSDIIGENVNIQVARNNSTFNITDGTIIIPDGDDTIDDPTGFEFQIYFGEEKQASQYFDPNTIGTAVKIDISSIVSDNKKIKNIYYGDDTTTPLTFTTPVTIDGVTTTIVNHPEITITSDESETVGFTPTSAKLTFDLETVSTEGVTYTAPTFVSGLKSYSYTYTFGTEEVTGKMFAVYADTQAYPNGEWGIAVAVADSTDIDIATSSSYQLYPSSATAGYTFGIAIIDEDLADDTYVSYATYYKPESGNIVFGNVAKVTFPAVSGN